MKVAPYSQGMSHRKALERVQPSAEHSIPERMLKTRPTISDRTMPSAGKQIETIRNLSGNTTFLEDPALEHRPMRSKLVKLNVLKVGMWSSVRIFNSFVL